MATLYLCAAHVKQLHAALTARGADAILLPPNLPPPPCELGSGRIPDLLSIAMAHLMIRALSRPIPEAKARAINAGGCVACCLDLDGWLDFSSVQAIELFMTHIPAQGHA